MSLKKKFICEVSLAGLRGPRQVIVNFFADLCRDSCNFAINQLMSIIIVLWLNILSTSIDPTLAFKALDFLYVDRLCRSSNQITLLWGIQASCGALSFNLQASELAFLNGEKYILLPVLFLICSHRNKQHLIDSFACADVCRCAILMPLSWTVAVQILHVEINELCGEK